MAEKTMSSFAPVLDGTNYPQWARRMAALLVNMDLDDVVGFNPKSYVPDKTAPSLLGKETKEAVRDFDRRDLKAKGIIEMRISDSLLAITQSADTAHDAWKMLYETFQRKSVSTLVCCMKQLFKTTKSASQSVQEYITDKQS